jgi:hypothetical protein
MSNNQKPPIYDTLGNLIEKDLDDYSCSAIEFDQRQESITLERNWQVKDAARADEYHVDTDDIQPKSFGPGFLAGIEVEPQEAKYDQGKSRMDLLPFDSLEAVGKVLAYGAKLYGERSWQRVEKSRYLAALLRHLAALSRGEAIDPESGLSHASHLACNALFFCSLADKEPK